MAVVISEKQWGNNKKKKFRNSPVRHDGQFFPSKRELSRYKQLQILERAKQIKDLKRQVPFAFSINGCPIFKYYADFTYTLMETNGVVVEDAKGVATPLYRLKKKIIEAEYGIRIIEV